MINVIFGASMGGFRYLKDKCETEIHYFCDNDPKKVGKRYFGIEVISAEKLNPKTHFIYICSVYFADISKQLRAKGYKSTDYKVVNPNFNLFISSKTEVHRFFKKCTQKGIDYSIIRNWEDIFNDGDIGDVDIIIRDDHILTFKKMIAPHLSNSGIKIDLYSVFGTSGYRFNNMPYFPLKLANAFLENFRLVNGVKVPSEDIELVGLLYHCLCYKGLAANIPLTIDAKLPYTRSLVDPTNDYDKKIHNINSNLGSNKRLGCLLDYYQFLCDDNFMPSFDVYRKTITDDDVRNCVQNCDRVYQNCMEKAADYNLDDPNNRYLMLFLRSRVQENGIRKALDTIIEQMYNRVKLVYSRQLNRQERQISNSSVRGGNWVDDYGVRLNGEPVEIWILKNISSSPLSDIQKKYFPFKLSDDTYFLKEEIRGELSNLIYNEDNLNVIHSTDDNLELVYYCDILNVDLECIIKTNS